MISTFLAAWCISACVMLAAWLIYTATKSPGIVDLFWSIAIVAPSLFYSATSHHTPVILLKILVALWSLRLFLFLLLTRYRSKHLDKRYIKISQGWKNSPLIGFFINYQLQALLGTVIATPFFFIAQIHHPSWHLSIAYIIIIIGIIGETLSDYQAYKHKKVHTTLCTTGLWRYSRHPNYFFDWLTWLGFALASLNTPRAFIGLISPLVLLWIMLKITGPITEASSIASRGSEYTKYQKSTPMFFLNLKRIFHDIYSLVKD